jgi:dephospho-CoA kinase
VTVRLGVTGPIGCGKSTVAGWLAAQPGIVVVDADRVARDVLAPGTAATAAVIARFGPAIAEAGAIDRAALGRIVFADPEALRELEAIVHPAVRPRILEAIRDAERDGAKACVIEAIKLVEGGLADLCDAVWLVDCDRARQVERLVGRGMARDDAEARIASQGDLADRLRLHATTIIDTNADPATTRSRVEAALTTLLDHAGAEAPGINPRA